MSFTEGRLSLHDFVCDRVLFSFNKEFVKKIHFGVKNVLFVFFFFFVEIPVFLRIFWSGAAVPLTFL